MAKTITSDLATISSVNSTTDGGTVYRLGGASSSNPATDSDAFVQGTGCVAWKCSGTVSPTDTGGHINLTTTFNPTNKHVFVWALVVTAGNMNTKANQGLSIGLTNTSTTSTSAWSTTNYKKWWVDGKDTQPSSNGWVCYVIDPSSTPNQSAGTLDLTTIKNVGLVMRQVSGVTSTLNNLFMDAIRAGTRIETTTTTAGDVLTLADIYATDSAAANSWGILTSVAGVYYGAGGFAFGTTGNTNVVNYSDSDQVLIFRDYPVAETFYALNVYGSASFPTNFTWNRCVVRSQGSVIWTLYSRVNTVMTLTDCNLSGMRQLILNGDSIVSGCSVQAINVYPYGGEISNCTIKHATLRAGYTNGAVVLGNLGYVAPNISDTTIVSNGSSTSHGLYIAATGTYDLTNVTFQGFAPSNGSVGNEAVWVDLASGTVTLNISGGTIPSVRTSGATVVVNATASLTLTGLQSGSEVRAYVGTDPATATEIGGVESSGATFSFNHSNGGQSGYIVVFATGFKDIRLPVVYSGSNAEIPIQQSVDRVYSNP